MNRLLKKYREEVVPELTKQTGETNVMAIPKITKVTLNVGVGKALQADPKIVETVVANLARVTGQRPVQTKAKKSISNFKSRQGQTIGVAVTLRGEQMYEFLDKLVSSTLPRVRDFRGISPLSFDGRGNYSLGMNEHTVFPEIKHDEVEKVHGLEINITTTAKNDDEGRLLLKLLGFPFNTDKLKK